MEEKAKKVGLEAKTCMKLVKDLLKKALGIHRKKEKERRSKERDDLRRLKSRRRYEILNIFRSSNGWKK
jgi:hypothetical protein